MSNVPLFAQTDRELLQELVKQQAVTNTEIKVVSTEIKNMDKRIDVLEKTIDKRFEMTEKAMDKRFDVMLAILAGIFGLVGFIVWDRQVSIKPILEDNKELIRKIEKVGEKELKLEEKVNNYFRTR